MPVSELRKHYPELNHVQLVEIDIIDDGETLENFTENSLDFVIANHMLEHCENPIGTLQNHFRKLKNGGIGYYAVPDKNFTFDRDRDLTTFEHVIFDDNLGASGSREQHFREWVTHINKKEGDEAARLVRHLMKINYSIHFHVWDYNSFREFIIKTNKYLGNVFKVEEIVKNEDEIICILRKGQEGNLDDQLKELEKEKKQYDETKNYSSDIQARNAELSRMVATLEGEIKSMLNSNSWRLTQPLRGFRKIIGKVFNKE
jgi:SAM-dependent methyltransferase